MPGRGTCIAGPCRGYGADRCKCWQRDENERRTSWLWRDLAVCNPAIMLTDKGELAAERLTKLLKDGLAHAFLTGAPAGYATYRVKRFIHEEWAELKILAHAVHDSPLCREWANRPLPDEMPDYAVSG